MATIPSLPLFTSGPLTSGKLNRLRDVIALWQNPPAAMARASASQNITTAGSYQLVTLHTSEFDTDTIVTSTTRFTVKTAGRYIVAATATFSANGSGARYVTVRKNAAGSPTGGTVIASGAAAPSSSSSTTVSLPANLRVQLAVNDTLEMFVYQDSGATLTLNSSPGDTFMLLQLDSVTATLSGTEATNIQSLHAESDLSTGDLDSVLTPGNYVQATAANATLARHYPVASVGGHLQVYSDGTASPTTTTQMFETTANAVYIRHRAGTTWSAWAAISGGGTALSGLTDVNTAGATDTQSLSWDTTTSKWIPESKAAAVHTHAAADVTSGTMATARLGSGTASASTFLRGDGTWAAPSLSGSGSPLSVVTPASVGLVYADTAVTTGARLWVSTGTTNTSWKVLAADTGQRLLSGFTGTDHGDLRIRRVNDFVILTINEISLTATTNTDVYSLPTGFQPVAWSNYAPMNDKDVVGATTSLIFCKVAVAPSASSGVVRFISHTTNDWFSLVATWPTNDAWPTSLPGTAV